MTTDLRTPTERMADTLVYCFATAARRDKHAALRAEQQKNRAAALADFIKNCEDATASGDIGGQARALYQKLGIALLTEKRGHAIMDTFLREKFAVAVDPALAQETAKDVAGYFHGAEKILAVRSADFESRNTELALSQIAARLETKDPTDCIVTEFFYADGNIHSAATLSGFYFRLFPTEKKRPLPATLRRIAP